MNISKFHKLIYWLYVKKVPFLPKVIYYIHFILFNSSVLYQTYIGRYTVFGYGGIVVAIHARNRIGTNCIIEQCTTFGGISKQYNVPIIGDYVDIGAGARILGDITIGNNVVIGANSVVIDDVPSNSVVAGIPAKVIKTNINMEDYV